MALHGEDLARPSYTFLHTIAEGNVGICRLHRHEVFGDLVVQKTISLLGIPDAIARSEPQLLQDARHPHIVEVREAQFDPEHPEIQAVTFVTTYYAGGSIYTALEQGHPFSTATSLELGRGILEALDYLHGEKSIIHRDIKPGNVMLNEDRNYAYVGDLGSAAYLDANGEADAAAGSILYLPPEYATGRIDIRADLYAAGMVLVELLNGPFPYDQLDQDGMQRRLDNGRRSLPDRHFRMAPWVPLQVARFVGKLVATDPARRFASAAEALRALNRLRYVSWERADGVGLTGRWRGTWPPTARAGHRRELELEIAPIVTGRYAGSVRAVASHRIGVRPWRSYARLARRFGSDDVAAAAAFFRAVEEAAQSALVR